MSRRVRWLGNTFLTVFAVTCFGISIGCGGGTSGTSSTGGFAKVFHGDVMDESNTPVVGARVTLEPAGANATTGSRGEFSFVADVPDSGAVLGVQRENQSEKVALPPLAASESAVRLDVTLGAAGGTVRLRDFELVLNSIGGGECEGAFGEVQVLNLAGGQQPLLIVNQEKALSPGTRCEVTFHVFSGGTNVSGLPWELVAAGFASVDPSTAGAETVDMGTTGADGTGRAKFQIPAPGEVTFFIIEVPADRPRYDRVGIIINPFYQVLEVGGV